MEANQQELVDKFTGVTGVDADRAKFYLESSGWMLDVALGSFYEDDDQGELIVSSAPSQPASSANRFATLSSLQDEDDDDDEEQGQAFYAGGSERGGGQQVLGPPKKKQSADDFIQNMFKAAKEHGAETVEAGSSSSEQPKSRAFKGTGYRLGETEDSSAVVQGERLEQPQQVDVVLKFWQNGFSIDEGPLRDFRDPSNKDFLDSIHRGEVPRELLRLAKGGEVNLNMEDHRGMEYVQPKVAVKAFSGAGHMLGSPVPAAAAAQPSKPDETAAKSVVTVDTAQPQTSIQIRLADGSRMVAKFNHSHTVGDIRRYILAAHPHLATANFALMTTFPSKELSDDSVTVSSANLLNAVLVQRMK